MRPIRLFHLCVLLTVILPFITQAQVPSPMANTFVNDFAHVLSASDIEDLNQQIKQLEERDSVQVAIILVKQLPEDMEIEDYAREIGRQWHAGIDRRGLVYVMSISQHKQRLEVAANLEGIIPDITARTMTDSLKPLLRTGDYGGAMKNLVMWITVALENNTGGGEAGDNAGMMAKVDSLAAGAPVQESPVQQEAVPVGHSGGGGIFLFLVFGGVFFIIMVVGIIAAVFRRRGGVYNSSGVFIESYSETTIYESSSSDSSSDSSSSSSSDFGDWGGSSDSSSPDSGFDGGGSSNDW